MAVVGCAVLLAGAERLANLENGGLATFAKSTAVLAGVALVAAGSTALLLLAGASRAAGAVVTPFGLAATGDVLGPGLLLAACAAAVLGFALVRRGGPPGIGG